MIYNEIILTGVDTWINLIKQLREYLILYALL